MTSLTLILFVIALSCGIVGIAVGTIGLALSSSSSSSDDNEDSEVSTFCSREANEMLGRPHDRVIEVLDYLDEHAQGLGMPDWYDDPIIKCNIVGDLVEMEQAQGTTFEGDDLDGNLALLISKSMGDAAERLLENPDQYLNP